ncbi:MAG: non-ribosomal peptide synthetase [Bacteroidetes bacterium]|nr:non-ribosomal peptide synthetase [Bacteroidota bacterium]
MLTNKNIQDIYTLSPLQQGIYFQWLYNRSSSNYFEQMSYSIHGSIDAGVVEHALNQLVARYDILRTVFNHERTGQLLQVVVKERQADFTYLDLRSLPGDKQKNIAEHLEADRSKGFDLNKDVLMRVILIRSEENEYHFIWSHHHILMDGWCVSIITAEFFHLYACGVAGRSALLPAVKQYRDYIEWLNECDKAAAKDYWTKYLAAFTKKTGLPASFGNDETEEKYEADHVEKIFPEELSVRMRHYAEKNHVTLNNFIQVLWGVLLAKYNNTTDVVFGSIVSGRPAEIPGIETMVGLFINTIPVRLAFESGETFNSLLKRMHAKAIESEAFHYSPLNEIQSYSPLKQGLLDHIMVFENYPVAKSIEEKGAGMMASGTGPATEIKDIWMFRQTNYNFNMAVIPGQEISIRFDYNACVYDRLFVESIFGHFENIVSQVMENDSLAIEGLKLVKKEEADRITEKFNDTAKVYPSDTTIVQLFEEQVKRHGSLTAVEFNNSCLTYTELNEKANQLAAQLIGKGVTPDSVVGIIAERSCEMIIGIIAILKAGGAYLPVDPAYPDERILHMIKNSEAAAVLTYSYTLPAALQHLPAISLADGVFKGSTENPPLIPAPGNLAYVIYTSGSTGLPKGVMVEHRAFLNIKDAYFKISAGEKTTLSCNFVFDVSVLEIFSSLLNGACLCIPPAGVVSDPADYADFLQRKQITTAYLHPMHLQPIANVLKNFDACFLKRILIGVEPIKHEMIKWYLHRHIEIINGYGPTETTICATFYKVNTAETKERVIPIGKPLQNMQVFILDDQLEMVPAGIKGEICIAGVGLARGYINDPGLTAAVFVNGKECTAERIYRTGDTGRWLPDGNLEFQGRKDNQVKLNGYRIELGEIEACLSMHPAIAEAAVIIDSKENSAGLTAFIVVKGPAGLNELREFLSRSLPKYMFPSRFVIIPKLPVTSNGKIDRKGLLQINGNELLSGVKYVSPRNIIEEKLAEAFESVLGTGKTGILENFFETGGDSIKAIQLSSRMHKEGYRVSVKDIFKFPTIGTLSAVVKKSIREIDQSPVSGKVMLTPVQQDFFLSGRPFPGQYSQSVMLYAADGFEEKMIRTVFSFLQDHHDALRMTFSGEEGNVDQYNREAGQELGLITAVLPAENFAEELSAHAQKLHKSIDMKNGPLMKLGLFKSDKGDRLVIVIHHLVIDGISWRILFEDIGILHKQHTEGMPLSLPPKSDSFKSWAQKLSEYANTPKFLKERSYWEAMEKSGAGALFNTGNNYNASEGHTEVIRFRLNEEQTKLLITDANKAYSTEINDLLLAAFGMAMRSLFNCHKLQIAMEGHGREELMADVDISRTIGWFTSLFPVVLDMSYTADLSRQLREVKETLHRLPNKGIGYWMLKYLTKPELRGELKFDLSPEIAFNYLGQFDADVSQLGFEIREDIAVRLREETAKKYVLDITGRIVNHELEIFIEYNSALLPPAKAEQLAAFYKDELKTVIAHCVSKNEKDTTPSDFIYSGMSIEDLDSIFN